MSNSNSNTCVRFIMSAGLRSEHWAGLSTRGQLCTAVNVHRKEMPLDSVSGHLASQWSTAVVQLCIFTTWPYIISIWLDHFVLPESQFSQPKYWSYPSRITYSKTSQSVQMFSNVTGSFMHSVTICILLRIISIVSLVSDSAVFFFSLMQTVNQVGNIFHTMPSPVRVQDPSSPTLTDKTRCLWTNTASTSLEQDNLLSCLTSSNTRVSAFTPAFQGGETSFAWVIAWHGSLVRHSDEPTLGREDRCWTTGLRTCRSGSCISIVLHNIRR